MRGDHALADPYSINPHQPVNRNHRLALGRKRWWKALPLTMGGDKWHDLEGNQTISPSPLQWSGGGVPKGGWASCLFDNNPIELEPADTSGFYHDPFSQWSMLCTARLAAGIDSGNYVLLDIGGSSNGAALAFSANVGALSAVRGATVFSESFEAGAPFSNGWTQIGTGTLTQVADSTVDGSYVARKGGSSDPDGGYTSLSSTVNDFEYIVHTKRVNTSGGSANRYSIVDNGTNTDGYGFFISNNKLVIEKRSGGTWIATELVSTNFGWDADQWYTFRLIKHGNDLQLQIWVGIQTDFTVAAKRVLKTTDSSFSSFGAVGIHGGHDFDTDGMRVYDISGVVRSDETAIESVYRDSNVASLLSANVDRLEFCRVASVFDGPSQEHRLYVNGVLVGSAATSFSTISEHASAATLGGGDTESLTPTAFDDSSYGNLKGSMDDVVFYDRAISGDEAAEDYDLSRRYYPGLLNRISAARYFVPAAPTGATPVSAATDLLGEELTLTMSEATTEADSTGWTVAIDGVEQTPTTPSGSGTTALVFGLSPEATAGATITISYDADVGNAVATSGGAAVASFIDFAVTNNVPAPPTPQSADVLEGSGTVVAVMFDAGVTETDALGWSLTADGTPVAMTYLITSVDGQALIFTLGTPIVALQTVLMGYDAATGDAVATSDGTAVESFTGFPVTNNVRFTASVSLSAPAATVSASATHTAPEYEASVSLTAPSAVVDADATHDAPEFEAIVGLTAPSAVVDADITHTAPTFEASVGLTAPSAVVSASAAFDSGTFTASADLTAPSAVVEVSATHVAPEYEASVALSSPPAVVAASGAFDAPVFTASVAAISPPSVADASGTFEAPVFTAAVAVSAPTAVVEAIAALDPPVFTASVGATAPAGVAAASATFEVDTVIAVVTATAPAASVSVSATYTPPDRPASVAAVAPPGVAAGSSTFEAPVFAASAAVIAPASAAAASATFSVEAVTATIAAIAPMSVAAASATYAPPDRQASVAAVAAAAVMSAIANFEPPLFEATASLTAPAGVAAGVASFETPIFTTAVASSAPPAVVAASGSFEAPVFTASVAVVAPLGIVDASAVYSAALRAADVSLVAPPSTVSAAASADVPVFSATVAMIGPAGVVNATSDELVKSTRYLIFSRTPAGSVEGSEYLILSRQL